MALVDEVEGAVSVGAIAADDAAIAIAAEVMFGAVGAKGLVRFEGVRVEEGEKEVDDACCNCDCDCDREAEDSAPVEALELSVSRFMSRGACRTVQSTALWRRNWRLVTVGDDRADRIRCSQSKCGGSGAWNESRGFKVDGRWRRRELTVDG